GFPQAQRAAMPTTPRAGRPSCALTTRISCSLTGSKGGIVTPRGYPRSLGPRRRRLGAARSDGPRGGGEAHAAGGSARHEVTGREAVGRPTPPEARRGTK